MQGFLENNFSFTVSNETNMYYCGKRVKTIDHSYGPEIREYYLLMYCVDGKATCHTDNGDIRFGSHDLFIMHPNKRIFYEADKGTEWTSWWVGVYGSVVDQFIKMLNIDPEYPFIHIEDNHTMELIMKDIFDYSNSNDISGKTMCISLIYRLFAFLFSNEKINYKSNIVSDALNVINHNAGSNLNVESIAAIINVNPCYLSRIFKAETGKTPKEYILERKLKRAEELLCHTNSSISEVAGSVGFSDALYFSRLFKKKTGFTPTDYRIKYKPK